MIRARHNIIAVISIIAVATAFSCKRTGRSFDEQRAEMVRQQLEQRGITESAILDAFRTVPREEFILQKYKEHAYDDLEAPLGFGQSLDRAYENAVMIGALEIGPNDRVLEVGTGSGYLSAVMSRIAREVYTIEIEPPIADLARANIARIGYRNISVKTGDGFLGWPEHAPFDAIVLTCSADKVAEPLAEQLAEGGRLLMPFGGTKKFQELILYKKEGGRLVEARRVAPTTFVPMKGMIEE